MKKIAVITDNVFLFNEFKRIIREKNIQATFDFYSSKLIPEEPSLKTINLKENYNELIKNKYEIVFSVHCKQLFPDELVNNIKCINIHPGLNPYNRGWFPQVFSIINGLPLGATIHEIDNQLDHGPIIVQEEVPVFPWDTSASCYERVLEKEIELLENHLSSIINLNYVVTESKNEGNLNLKKDFNELCQINLEEKLTMLQALNKLRALTHNGYKNAYFFDANNNKVYVNISLEKENQR